MFTKPLNALFILLFIMAAGLHVSVTEAQIVEDGLVSYWSFDKGSVKGEQVTDTLADKEGVIIGDPKTVAGKIGEGLELDGDDHVEIPDDVGGKESVTITVWVKPTDFKSDRTVLGYWPDTPTSELLLYYDVDDHIWRFIVRESGESAKDVKVQDPEVDKWTHLAVSYEKGGELKLYVNGVAEVTDAPDAPIKVGGGPWFGIGWDNSNSHPPFVGIIDEVCFYERSLSQEEVRKNFQATTGLAVQALGRLATAWGGTKSDF